MIINCGLELINTSTTIGMRIPNVPQEVPVEKARKHATMKMIAGRKFIKDPALLCTASATKVAAPRESVMAFSVQAKVRIRIAGTMALKPSGRQAIQSLKLKTLLIR